LLAASARPPLATMAVGAADALEAGQPLHRVLSPRRLRRGSGGRVALLLAAVGLLPVALGPWALSEAAAGSTQALTLPEWKENKVLFTHSGYELRVMPRKTKNKVGKAIPKVLFREIPPQPVSLVSAMGSVESEMDKEMMGFPFTTDNAGSLAVGFPRVKGLLKLSLQDPPVSAELEDAVKAAELSYEQRVKGVGHVGARVKSNGEWTASVDRMVEDIGHLHTTLNSQLDWSVDLDTSYAPVKGISPAVSYGATQDGMRVRAKLNGVVAQGTTGMYQVQNLPGKYTPMDLVHDARLEYSSASGRQSVTAEGQYDRRLPKRPIKGTLSYAVHTSPVTLTAAVDFERARLKAATRFGQVTAAVGLKAPAKGEGQRPAEIGVKLGPVSAQARLNGSRKPRLRLELAA